MKSKRSRSTSKEMIAIFFAKPGQLASVSIQERKTVNAEWYINTCLSKIFEARSACLPNIGTCDLLLHHDNASAHNATAILDHLEANRVQLVTQTPYSLGLAPCDLFLFPQELAFEGEAVSGCRRCWRLLRGRDF